MRLIEAASLKLRTAVFDDDVPAYAILSHTWGPTEVSLQEFADPSLGAKDTSMEIGSGYWKIKKACEQAVKDNLKYVWVDTCCIDKTSSSELSEAINSMFRWYKEAWVCYAYLADVIGYSHPTEDEDSQKYAEMNRALVAKSRWFKRGWTLQELLAPNKIRFYDDTWRYIGTKMQLCRTIEGITGISADVLRTGNMEDESIAKRMSWMTHRKTTRPEDMAYSLMGIFDVNMPLLYGEGDKAFVRLQEEIMKDSADNSLFVWNTLRRPDDRSRPAPELSSIFAAWPRQFDTSRIWNKRRLDEDYARESYALTNLGVHIKLRLKRYDHPWYGTIWGHDYQGKTFVAMLGCQYDGPDPAFKRCRPGIFLVQISPPRPEYARISNAGVVFTTTNRETYGALRNKGIESRVLFTEEDTLQTVYLRKKIPGWAQVPKT
ncbi:HET domain-containing protein [Pyrenophora tritici-repentis]|nr:HET domain-containing protein [Pyrenophora tritici-repentis]KAI0608098.1 HET domain-containing protein [Pyrenophora tritici-repentis]KAI0620371.1 HET domain-containing protein [Pyrenophora tritici-repentis]KAI1573076.1 HET domain containing protein [Pyrenophora tritici-repentis]KAI1592364.1 HET domain containing protein [Pyrenophora tritici-repentis]